MAPLAVGRGKAPQGPPWSPGPHTTVPVFLGPPEPARPSSLRDQQALPTPSTARWKVWYRLEARGLRSHFFKQISSPKHRGFCWLLCSEWLLLPRLWLSAQRLFGRPPPLTGSLLDLAHGTHSGLDPRAKWGLGPGLLASVSGSHWQSGPRLRVWHEVDYHFPQNSFPWLLPDCFWSLAPWCLYKGHNCHRLAQLKFLYFASRVVEGSRQHYPPEDGGSGLCCPDPQVGSS